MMSKKQRYEQLIGDLKRDFRPQRRWTEGRGFFLVFGHYLVGGASGTWLLARYFGADAAMALSIVLAGLGGIAHLINLGRPERALNMAAKVKTSWVARGFWGLSLLMLGGVLYLAPRLVPGFLWGSDSLVAVVGDVLAGIGTIILLGYMGTAYMVSKSVAIWNSKLHPLLYLLYSARSGAAIMILVAALQSHLPQPGMLQLWLVATALMILLWVFDLYLAPKHGLAARQSVHDMLVGRFARFVYGGVWLLGIILPVVLIAMHKPDAPSYALLAIVGLAAYVGDFFIKYSSVGGGVHKRVRYLGTSAASNMNPFGSSKQVGVQGRAS